MQMEESKALSKENKSKKSKKWKRKSHRGETSASMKNSSENGTDSDLCDNEEGKPSARERKSLKDRIKKMSIRKSSKADRRNGSRLSEKTEEELSEREQEASKVGKEPELCEENHDGDGIKAEEKMNGSYVSDEHCDDIGEEGLRKIEEQDKLAVIRECTEKDKVDPAQAEQENENFLESSCEVRKLEEDERRKSKENFDAVIAELVCKEVDLKEEPIEQGTMHNCESKTQEEKAPRCELLETETDGIINEDSPIENAEQKGTESTLLDDKSSSTVSISPKPDDEPTTNNCIDYLQRSHHDDLEQEMKTNLDPGFENNAENKDKKVFRHINDENLDISQKITKKTVGKVVGRYRQVHLTKTYCQCCSLM